MNMAKKFYSACIFCTEFKDISSCHRQLTYLTDLLRNCTLEADDKMLFRKIKVALLELSVKFRFLPNKKKNQIVSKYYIYYMKHNHLLDNEFHPTYSPIRREEFLKEFEEHLKIVVINNNN